MPIKIVKRAATTLPAEIVQPPQPKPFYPAENVCDWCGNRVKPGCTFEKHNACFRFHSLRRIKVGVL